MELIQIKIEKDNAAVKYIKLIREFDSSLSVGAIKKKIDENDFAVEFDLEYYDVIEDLMEVDRKKLFRNMIDKLCKAGADISLYQDGEPISMEELDNRLGLLEEISRAVEKDIERECGRE